MTVSECKDNAQLFNMDTSSSAVLLRTENVNKDIHKDVEKRFDTPNYDIGRTLPIRKKIENIGLMKDDLGIKTMKQNVELTPKVGSYRKDNDMQ